MQHTGQADIVNEFRLAGQKSWIFVPENGLLKVFTSHSFTSHALAIFTEAFLTALTIFS